LLNSRANIIVAFLDRRVAAVDAAVAPLRFDVAADQADVGGGGRGSIIADAGGCYWGDSSRPEWTLLLLLLLLLSFSCAYVPWMQGSLFIVWQICSGIASPMTRLIHSCRVAYNGSQRGSVPHQAGRACFFATLWIFTMTQTYDYHHPLWNMHTFYCGRLVSAVRAVDSAPKVSL
jgi:hypothetical protein